MYKVVGAVIMASTHHSEYIEELSWENVRSDILKINPEFVDAVDKVGPDKKHTVFKIRYYYGDEILKRAVFHVPNEQGRLVPITDSSILPHIRESLGYNLGSNPVMMLLNNALEIFLPLEDRTISMNSLVAPGRIVGTYRLLTDTPISHHPAFVWDMTAGARSIFLLKSQMRKNISD
jgi:hypothetical protein